MKKISAYQTTDGELFSNQLEAEGHQAALEFEHWYNFNQLIDIDSGEVVDSCSVKEWLLDHRDMICQLFTHQAAIEE